MGKLISFLMINHPIEVKLKEIFPKTYYLFSDDIKSILNTNSETHNNIYLNKNQIELVNKYVNSNSKILIYSFISKRKTAFTIPGLIDKEVLTNFNGISDIINCNMNLYRLNMKGGLDNNKIKLTSKISNTILPIFIEKSLLNQFSERELMAIYLHEIGHWINYRLYFSKNLLIKLYEIQHLFLNPFLFIPIIGGAAGFTSYITGSGTLTTFGYFVLFFIIIGICLSSLISAINIKNEYDSDDFAKKMGFGAELTKMLNKPLSNDFPLKLEQEHNISQLTKSSLIMFSLITPILYSLFWFFKNEPEDSIESHPESHHRVKVLLADSLSYINNNKNIIHEHFDDFKLKLIFENVEKLDNINFSGMLSSFGNLYASYDDFVYMNRKSIFPHKFIF